MGRRTLIHGELAAGNGLGQALVDEVLEDFESAEIEERLRAMLRYLQTMTVAPENLNAECARALCDAGVSHAAAIEAVEVGFAFDVIHRLADSCGFDVPTPERFARTAPRSVRNLQSEGST